MLLAGALIEKWKWLRGGDIPTRTVTCFLISFCTEKTWASSTPGNGKVIVEGTWRWPSEIRCWSGFFLLELHEGQDCSLAKDSSEEMGALTKGLMHLVDRCAAFTILARYSLLLWFCVCRLWVSTPKQTIRWGWDRSAFYLDNYICFFLHELFWYWLKSFVNRTAKASEYNFEILCTLKCFFFNLFLLWNKRP